ncbi:hypothetical protein FA95DRAFT_1562383 [Auriscalpium vulgare]|uniref:Uncharacterized protein n=1 Tax=Auriscalpium vulgare TaxID=40419 RepID=A0ACB8RK62_9AGAM|nr:hypothetical protein FA95DRAFT_1562383 [Auriscalpium vulgare]
MNLSVDVVTVDPIARVMTLDWQVIDDSCIPSNFLIGDPFPSNCPLVNIYVDQNLLAPFQGNGNQPQPIGSSALSSSALSSTPIFQYNVSSLLLYASSSAVFRTTLAMYSRSGAIGGPVNNRRALERSPENYPFDTYATAVIMFAQTNDTSAFVTLSIDDPTGIAFGYYVKAKRLFEDQSAPVDPGFDFVYLPLVISRAALVKTYAIVAIMAMWSITLCLVAIALKAVVFGHTMDSAALVVPAATLFAFTSLRSTLPGAPAQFGAIIDFVGTLPAIALLLVATVICLMAFLLRRPAERHTERHGGGAKDEGTLTQDSS